MARLLEVKRPDGKYPFDYRNATATDVRATWDRLDPGWRNRRPGQSKPEQRVTEIRKRSAR